VNVPSLTSFRRDGLVFDVVDEGPRDQAREGSVVVLLHGFPQRANSWSAVSPLLTAAGFRVLAPDQRGYSPRARPRGRAAYAMRELVADVVALIDAADSGPVHLVGHDWGAAVGWAVATLHPERLCTFTAVSVPHPQAMVRSLTQSNQLLKSWYVAALQAPCLPELTVRWWPGWVEANLRRSGMEDAAITRFRHEIVADGAFASAINWYRAIPFGGPSATQSADRLIRVPTTLVWSDQDVAITRCPVDLCAHFIHPNFRADYRLVVLPGVDHWIPEHAPGRLTESILRRISG
jgi:pimeloyl-ACP methyl ester carboxylesterase